MSQMPPPLPTSMPPSPLPSARRPRRSFWRRAGAVIDAASRWGGTASQWLDGAAHAFRWLAFMAVVLGITALAVASIVLALLEG